MKNTIRTFIAIKITPEKKLTELVSWLKEKLTGEAIKWVELNNLHLTLRFLGDTTPEQVQEISKMLDDLPGKFDSFQFSLKGTGYFKSKGQPRVLCLTIENDTMLKKVVEVIENRVVQSGFESESREFKPHLTLARIKFIKNKTAFYSLVNNQNPDEIQSINVSEIIFYQSILNPDGPVYKPIKKAKLK